MRHRGGALRAILLLASIAVWAPACTTDTLIPPVSDEAERTGPVGQVSVALEMASLPQGIAEVRMRLRSAEHGTLETRAVPTGGVVLLHSASVPPGPWLIVVDALVVSPVDQPGVSQGGGGNSQRCGCQGREKEIVDSSGWHARLGNETGAI